MNVKVSKKMIVDNYPYIIEIGYCALQNLLFYRENNYYTKGVYGWNADIYEITPVVCICTGYRPFGNIKPDYDTIRKYDKAALKIMAEHETPYIEKIDKIDNLLMEFIEYCKNLKDNKTSKNK